MSSIWVLPWTLVVLLQSFEGKGSIDSFQFDVNDILNEKFMPAHLLVQELESFLKGSSNITREHFYKQDNSTSNFTTAFTTMGFHRKMMNEYLATNFLAKQVLKELPLDYSASIERRIGTPSTNATGEATMGDGNRRKGKYIQNELLEDPGSTSYRSWLDKTTTLEDIQRQFSESNSVAPSDFKPLQREASNRRKSIENEEDGMEEEDFDDGDITGYAYSGGSLDSVPNFPHALPPPRHHLPFDATNNIQSYMPIHPTAISKNGYYPPSGHENTYNENYGPPVHHVQSQPQQHTKEISLKDILDIALTTLAFLSFGMFILQVLMCITMNKEDTSSMMMMPMEADGGTMMTNNNDATTEEIRRRKRHTPESRRIEMMNELSRRVLHSIDAVLLIPKDEGRCHYHSLCEINKYARQQKNGQKVWIPMWSLGISWFSSKMPAAANATTANTILESLKAAVVGLGNGDCTKMYRSCQMDIIADERRNLEKRIVKRDLKKDFKWSG